MAALHRPDSAVSYGVPLGEARAAVILVHGRGATAESMLPLADAIGVTDIAYIAPQAAGNVWYPNSFLAPIASNEPWLSSALALLGALVERLGTEGMPPERVGFVGFSQGACLSIEFSARHPRRYGFVAALSGGLIGPPGTPWAYTGSLAGTPILLGCSDIDPHIPLERVKESTRVLTSLGAEVDERIYPNMGHTVNEDEIQAVRELLRGVAGVLR
jgi:predicted esterase